MAKTRRRTRPGEGEAMAPIGTTACAILGLLSARAGTAYDLAKRMESNYRFFWPRAQSKLYEEVKRLVDAGLVRATAGATGKRPRTLYRINAAGRRALSAWLAAPTSAVVLEAEILLKAAYADAGSKAELLAHLAAVEAHARQMLAFGESLARAYAAGEVKLPERAPYALLVWRFMHGHFGAMAEWAAWAQTEVGRWRDTAPSERNAARARRLFRAAVTTAVTSP